MSGQLITIDAMDMGLKGVFKPDTPRAGKLSWTVPTSKGPQQVSISYKVEPKGTGFVLQLKYRATLAGGRAQDMDYPVTVETETDIDGVCGWYFICPVTRAPARKLKLPPGKTHFTADETSLVRERMFEVTARDAEKRMEAEKRANDAKAAIEAKLKAAQAAAAARVAQATQASGGSAGTKSQSSGQAAKAAPTPSDPLRQFAIAIRAGLEERGVNLADPSLDPFQRFGIQMYILGGAIGLANAGKLPRASIQAAVTAAVESAGMSAARVPDMVSRQEEYLTVPKYTLMMQLGEDGLHSHLRNDPSLSAKVADAMSKWQSKAEIRNAVNLMCFLFTDIVSSVQYTQAEGDHAMFNLVDTHNAIVRTALRMNKGKEVKHTGDGIMAAFDLSSDAIKFAIQCQRDIEDHNRKSGVAPLKIRIGINAGEAKVENNDYFGTGVQLAARVTAACGADEILVSKATRDLAAGDKSIQYFNAREIQAKGFPDPIPVVSVQWQDQ